MDLIVPPSDALKRATLQPSKGLVIVRSVAGFWPGFDVNDHEYARNVGPLLQGREVSTTRLPVAAWAAEPMSATPTGASIINVTSRTMALNRALAGRLPAGWLSCAALWSST